MNKELKLITNGLGESTAKTYTHSYNRLRKLLSIKDKRRPIKKIPLTHILNTIDLIPNPSSKFAVYIIATKIYNVIENKDEMDQFRQKINNEKREYQKSNNQKLNEDLPTYKQIDNALSTTDNPKKYITSFLIFHLNTRNMDVAYIDLHSSIKDKYNDERNHLVLFENQVIYIRNKYKTFSKYKQKVNIIKDTKFVNKVKEILNDNDMVSLYTNKQGGGISPSSIASYLKKYIVLGLSEGQIIKIVIKHIEANGNYDMLRCISANRGTSVQTLLTDYDISNLTEPTNITTNKHYK